MKTLIVSRDFPPGQIWGVGVHVNILAAELGRLSSTCVATSSGWARGGAPRGQIYRTPRLLDRQFLVSRYHRSSGYMDFDLLRSWNELAARHFGEKLLRDNYHPDLVHNHSWMTFDLSSKLAKRFGIPLVSTAHILETQYERVGLPHPAPLDRDAIFAMEQKSFLESNIVICPTELAAGIATMDYPEYAQKIRVVSHGIDFARIERYRRAIGVRGHSRDSSQRVLCVARLVREKGVEAFIAAMNCLVAGRETLVVDVVGDGPLRQDLEHQCRQTARIRFWGNIARNEVFGLMACADVFCSPSRTETFGMSLVEAMGFGVGVVATQGLFLPSIVEHEVSGLVMDVTDWTDYSALTDGLVENIARLLDDAQLARDLGQRAAVDVRQRFSSTTMGRETYGIFTEVLSMVRTA